MMTPEEMDDHDIKAFVSLVRRGVPQQDDGRIDCVNMPCSSCPLYMTEHILGVPDCGDTRLFDKPGTGLPKLMKEHPEFFI